MLPSPIQHPNAHCTSSTPLFLLMVPSIEPRASWILGKCSTIEIDSQLWWFILSVRLMRLRDNSKIVRYNSRYVYDGIFREGWGKMAWMWVVSSQGQASQKEEEERKQTVNTMNILLSQRHSPIWRELLAQSHILQHLELTAPSAK